MSAISRAAAALTSPIEHPEAILHVSAEVTR